MRQCHAVDVRVVEGEEGKPSESFVSLGGGRIGFDTPNRLHYLATRGQSISLVQEQRKEDQAGRATLALITSGVKVGRYCVR